LTSIPSLAEARLLAAQVGPSAEIEAIVLREVQWKAYELGFDLSEAIDVIPEFNMAHGQRNSVVRYKVNSKLTGRVHAGEVFRLEATHEAFFKLDESRTFTEDALGAYGAVTVFFMVFPYIRQVLHELTGNAGLPPVLLKPFLVPIDPSGGLSLPTAPIEA
jgi:preprotein translocase subunit SecB